jgi:hypothetical protein
MSQADGFVEEASRSVSDIAHLEPWKSEEIRQLKKEVHEHMTYNWMYTARMIFFCSSGT